ncbi:Bug family tripartite tricarboxylate transporter substrate binding protein [Azohydromonas aeria]|uniref:Bug family tripartite tricarboxylate transporter substrate binding protein n=1 Tax=Azohydromonas aeria TaxID=2590212 RepID=UPI0012FA00BB|nr:tripartite tricarboxylate transporter substrate binding protein [Azohydromonas aeria]
MRRRHLLLSTLALPALGAFAQSPLKLVVGFPPGTGPDVVARTLGQKLGELMKQPLVIDNRAGAGGQIATQAVARSAPDGTTVLLGEVGSIAIAPAAYSKLPYDPARELIPVAEVVRSDFILVVPASSPVKDVKGFIDAAKANRDRVNFATFGAGTPGHFGAELLAEQAGFRIEPVHYRATGDAITALVSGDVGAAFVSTALAVPQVKGGKLRALGTTAPARSPLLPEVPTFAEAGWPKLDFSAWFALFVPAGTPAAVVDQLGRQAVAAVQAPEVRQKLQEAGFSVTGVGRADTERMVRAEGQRWAGIVKASGFKAD